MNTTTAWAGSSIFGGRGGWRRWLVSSKRKASKELSLNISTAKKTIMSDLNETIG